MHLIPVIKNKCKLFSIADYLAIVLTFLFGFAGIAVSLNRFWQYDVFFYDFGIFDEAIWKAAHFRAPIIEHFVHEGQWIFADHFNPTIFLLSPLYWITNHSEIILIAQAVIFALSGILLYYLGKIVAKNNWYALSVLCCYFLFTGLQNAIITDFHEVSLTVFFIILTYFAFEKKYTMLYWISLLCLLGTKESNFALVIAIGISFFFLQRNRWKISVATIIFSFCYGMIATKLVIPLFSGNGYQYAVPLASNPMIYASSLVNNPIKLHTLIFSFGSFAFLPLLSPAFYIVFLEDFLSRFYPPFLTASWSLGFHYSAATAAIMAVSSLYGCHLLERFIKSKKMLYALCILAVLNALFLYRFVLRGPLALSYNQAFYAHSNDFSFLNTLIDSVPKNGSVMTQNNLAAHFTHRDIYLLRDKCDTCLLYPYEIIKPNYIVIDARDGQNPNDYYGVNSIKKTVETLSLDKKYVITYHKGDQYIFKRL